MSSFTFYITVMVTVFLPSGALLMRSEVCLSAQPWRVNWLWTFRDVQRDKVQWHINLTQRIVLFYSVAACFGLKQVIVRLIYPKNLESYDEVVIIFWRTCSGFDPFILVLLFNRERCYLHISLQQSSDFIPT